MPIPTLEFGSTGHRSTRLIFGAAALAEVTQDVADRVLEQLLEHGINHIDVAAGYGDAELRVGAVAARAPGRLLPRHQDRRADRGRGARGAAPLAGAARRRPGRPLAAAQPGRPDRVGHRAQPGRRDRGGDRGQGARDWSGSSASPATARQIAANHRRSLERFDFDSVLLPYNFVTMQNPYYAENFTALQETCAATRRRGADDQVGGAAALAGTRAHPRDLVRAVRGPGRPRPLGLVRAGPRRHPRDQRRRRGPAAAGARRRLPVRGRRPPTRRCALSPSAPRRTRCSCRSPGLGWHVTGPLAG